MNPKTQVIEEFSLPLPITKAARTIAQEFAAGQPTAEKVEQVYLNTLAVCVVNDYLQMMSIPTDLTAGDSWNPVVRLAADIADLEVTGLGRLECRPMKVNEQTCYIAPEVWEDRIGYVIVQFDEILLEATLLGFVPTVATEHLLIAELQPLEKLLVHLSQLNYVEPPLGVRVAAQSATNNNVINLSQWLQGVFDTSWQIAESLLTPQSNLAFSFRRSDTGEEFNRTQGSIRRAKLIDLGLQLAGNSIALIVELRQESNQKTDVLLQVHPTGSKIYLPQLLQLIVIDEYKAVFLEAQARSADNYIQLQFSGQPEERFSVKIALGDASITENFVI